MRYMVAWSVLMIFLGGVLAETTPNLVPPVKPAPVKTAVDPAPAPVPTVDPVGHWMRYLMALLGALTAAIPVFIQALRNGMATAATRAAIEETRVAQARLHGALADKLGLPPVPQEAPAVPTAPVDKLDLILARLEALEKGKV